MVATPDGRIVSIATRTHQTSLPRPGWAEHDADAIWWTDIVGLCRDLLDELAGGLNAIRGVCVSGIGPVLLAADAQGRPLRPAILYGIDTRATAEIAVLDERFGSTRILEQGGSPLTSQAVGPKLLWLRNHEPQVWDRMRRLFMASSFAVHRFTGEYVLDHHSASQCNPLYDIRSHEWAAAWADDIAPGLPLPRLLWPGQVAGTVTAAAAQETGIPAGTPVAAGTIDAWTEALSVDVAQPGDTMLMYGSTMFVVQHVRAPTVDRRLWCTAGITPGSWSLAGGMATTGSLTDWLRRLTGADFSSLMGEAAAVPPGSDGLLMLPYFAGERSPYFDADARGVIAGLTLRHGRAHLYRAALEAVAFGVRQHMDVFRDVGADPQHLVAVGGGTSGDLWTQIVSDVTGRAQQIPAITVGAAYGDALLAARAAGLADVDARWNTTADTMQPNLQHREIYDRLFARYGELYHDTLDVVHDLAAVQVFG